MKRALGCRRSCGTCGSPIGHTPVAEIDIKYEWLWLYAAVHPLSGKVFWLILPRLDTECVQLFLDEFAKVAAVAGKRIVLLWDGAPGHRGQKLKVPERIILVMTLAYTPELNPSERLWPLVKEGVANRGLPELLTDNEL